MKAFVAAYSFLGIRVNLRTDAAWLIEAVDEVYEHFRSNGKGQADFEISCSSLISSKIIVSVDKRQQVAVTSHEAFLPVFCRYFLDYLAPCLACRATLLHAAAISRGEVAMLLVGPSGRGKTTLSLNLLDRGYDFLSDDLSPLSQIKGATRVHPFPKAMKLLATPQVSQLIGGHVWESPIPGEGQVIYVPVDRIRPATAFMPSTPSIVVFLDGHGVNALTQVRPTQGAIRLMHNCFYSGTGLAGTVHTLWRLAEQARCYSMWTESPEAAIAMIEKLT